MKKQPRPSLISNEPLTPRQLWVLLLFIIALTFIAFLPSLSNGFVYWDDPEYYYKNPLFKDFSFSKVFSFSFYYKGNYHPLTLLWLRMEWLLFPKGNPVHYNGFNPFWFHLNDLTLHLLNTLLVFFVVHELLDGKSWKTAGVVALLFGIHPMHVESVAWLSEIKDVLYTAFYLGAAWFYLRYQKRIRLRYIAISFILFVLSCLAKGQAVTLPLLFLLFDYFKGRKFEPRIIIEKIPFIIISLFFGILAIEAQASDSAIMRIHYSSLSSICWGCWGLLMYLYKFFLPVLLCGYYPYPVNPFQTLPAYFYLLPVVIVILLVILYMTRKYSKDWLFGFLFFVFTISVTLRFIPVGDSVVAERYTYIPYIGLFFITGQLFTKYSRVKKWKIVSWSVLIFVVLILGSLTWQRTQVWKNSYTFWGNVVERQPDHWRAYNCLGQEYTAAGNYTKALEYYALACERDQYAPPEAYMNRGGLLLDKLENYDAAISEFRKVLAFPDKNDRSQLDARINLGIAYSKKRDYESASSIIDEAITMDPNRAICYLIKGIACAGQEKYEQADAAYTKALTISPDYIDAYLKRGILYTQNLGEYDKAIADFRKILQLDPGNKDASINIGICMYNKNIPDEAIKIYSKAIQQTPDDGKLYFLRSLAYERAKNFNLAYEDAMKARQHGYTIPDQQLLELKNKSQNP